MRAVLAVVTLFLFLVVKTELVCCLHFRSTFSSITSNQEAELGGFQTCKKWPPLFMTPPSKVLWMSFQFVETYKNVDIFDDILSRSAVAQ